MAKDLQDAALDIIKRNNRPIEKEVQPSSQSNSLYRNFYSIETGKPLSLEIISKRVKKRFSEIDRNSALAMMELFFIHSQWSSFYSRQDSFSKYVREELKISRTHAYSLLNSVELLNQYFMSKNKDINDIISEFTSSIEDVGVTKLSILAKFRDEKKKYTTLDRLLKGENITVESLLQKPSLKKRQGALASQEGDDVVFEEMKILTFLVKDKKLRTAVINAIEKYYRSSE